MLKHLEWTPLEERRAKHKVKILYKAREGLINIPLNHMHTNQRITRRSNESTYRFPSSRVNAHLYSFYPNVVRMWNNLPVEVQTSQSISSFDNKLKDIIIRQSYD